MKLKIKNRARFSLAVTTMVAMIYLVIAALAMGSAMVKAEEGDGVNKPFPLSKRNVIITPAAITAGTIEPIVTQSAIEKKEEFLIVYIRC